MIPSFVHTVGAVAVGLGAIAAVSYGVATALGFVSGLRARQVAQASIALIVGQVASGIVATLGRAMPDAIHILYGAVILGLCAGTLGMMTAHSAKRNGLLLAIMGIGTLLISVRLWGTG